MDFLTRLWNYIKVKFSGEEKTAPAKKTTNTKQPIFNYNKNTANPNEIPMMREISDEQIQANNTREKYITTIKNPNYKVKNGDNPDKIAAKFGVETNSLLALNGLDKNSAKKIKAGQILKIPPTRKIKNVNNLNDIAKSMGVSLEFIKKLKKIEDSSNLPETKFHNTPYKDKAGVLTIGIGHVLKKGDPRELSNQQVCELCAKDLLKMEENLKVLLGGQKNYDRLPQSMKEALLDMTFNKGTAIIEKTPGLLYCLKTGKYEAAINKFTNNKSTTTKQEMAGLSKRRLFDISLATKMYENNIPQSNINTAQQVYNRGVELLKAECKKEGKNYQSQLAGFNQEIQNYFGNRLKLKLITR